MKNWLDYFFDEVAAGIVSCAPTPAIARVAAGLTAHRLPASTPG
jgi:hypothetical protein